MSKKAIWMTLFARTVFCSLLIAITCSIDACGGGGAGGGGTTTSTPTTPTVSVTPGASAITTTQDLSVTVTVSGTSGTPTGSVQLSSGAYSSAATTLSSGSASIKIAAGTLAAGSDTLTAKYTPDTASSANYTSASGSATITVTKAVSVSVTVTPHATRQPFAENLIVDVAVTGNSGTSTGSVVLSGGGYTSPSTPLNAGAATLYLAPGSLAMGADTLTATYAPDSGSSYTSTTGTAAITITTPSSTNITVDIDTLTNRHQISPYIYGINSFNTTDIAAMAPTLVRFGGNEASNYNWKLHTYNSGADWFFEDFGLTDSNGNGIDSVGLTQYSVSAGSHMLTTMPMLDWVAKESGHWSFSVAKYGSQCKADPYNSDAGNGQKPDCKTPVTTDAVTDAYYPLVDTGSDCTSGNCLYRDEWTLALATAFGSETCAVPYSPIVSCHFYDMDNEPEIWDGTHADVHPVHPGYTELSNLFETTATNVKKWDPNAVRFGPITCCWNFYWTAGPSGDDKNAHGGVDFLPWWLNQVYWLDEINGARTLDVFDLHAYFGPNVDTTNFTDAQKRAAAGTMLRSYWDPTYYNAGDDQDWITTTQPNRGITFQIPRMKAMVNAIYPGTPLSFSEWESFVVPQSEWDFATALSDADAWGVMGREGLSFATRWGGPSATDSTTQQPHPNYQALKLYTTYDGAKHGFASISIADKSSANPDLFTSYAALDAAGTTMTVMVLNKDPDNTANVTFNLNGFTASSYKAYSLVSTNPGAITAAAMAPWTATQSFAPYSVTLLVISGTETSKPASEWSLNPDDLMVSASGTATLHPALGSGTAAVTLTSAVFDAFEGASACSGSLALTNPAITPGTPGTVTVTAGSTPGFCHYTVTGSDGTTQQTQGGWIVVGKPAGTLAVSGGNNQTGTAGTALAQPLMVTFAVGQSGASAKGAAILFTTTAGTLSNGSTSGKSVIATTDSAGVASVTLTLPASKGPVTVTAQDQVAVGGTTVSFTETAN